MYTNNEKMYSKIKLSFTVNINMLIYNFMIVYPIQLVPDSYFYNFMNNTIGIFYKKIIQTLRIFSSFKNNRN